VSFPLLEMQNTALLTCILAVAFLESMGLPKSKLQATRKQVESGTLNFKDSIEYKMYSRHDQPNDEIESDIKGNLVLKSGSKAEK
jgi:glycerol-3-phosphate dehydrogenase